MTNVMFYGEGRSDNPQMRIEFSNGTSLLFTFPADAFYLGTAVYQRMFDELKRKFGEDFSHVELDDIKAFFNHGVSYFGGDLPIEVVTGDSLDRLRIGKSIKQLREAKGMDAKTLASRISIDPGNLCRIEQGKFSVGIDILNKIAAVLDSKLEIVPINRIVDVEKLNKRSWIVPSNSMTFDIEGCLNEFGYVHWQQKNNFSIGDTIYIYCTKPEQRIRFKMVVSDVDLEYSPEVEQEQKYWVEKERIKAGINANRYAYFKLLGRTDSPALTFDNLLQNGVSGNIQGGMTISDKLLQYVQENF